MNNEDIIPTSKSGMRRVYYKQFSSRRAILRQGKLLFILATNALCFQINCVGMLPWEFVVKMKNGAWKTFRYHRKNHSRSAEYKSVDGNGDLIKIRNLSYDC